ncbi:MAG: DUF5662 family protein [Lachnospiraceae bacterium]|nr:DUF5662 family protein [Lachnospiraceae bacterium]
MSIEYDLYLRQHKANVLKGYLWIEENLPQLLEDVPNDAHIRHQMEFAHDYSKDAPNEYDAYDAWFYGNNKSYAAKQAYYEAWLLHIHNNPHHWQHWVLINDEPTEGIIPLDMPYEYILEMICDWWAFSWKDGKLMEIFDWYDKHKTYMKLSDYTRKTVDDILEQIKDKLEENINDKT